MGDAMGYKILYENKEKKRHNYLRVQILISTFLLLFALCVRVSWPAGRAFIQRLLVGEEFSQGAEAVMVLLQNLEEGTSIQDAVTVFCQELLYGG